ncbi:uncharacterized protein [Tenebrio molitor]|jgi:hypothetical protein|uniref:uncharacterized protein n=1 Tax=Tenebrio molitor TaxID=7067 RepID=UPI001C3C17EC|nr:unnamed protein product [Tenebrio molitor]
MQRIISLEASRSSNLTSEFVTKRLCCSFILTVAFFAVVGGFFLGRFASDKTLQKLKMDNQDILVRLKELNRRVNNTIQDSLSTNCTTIASRRKCEIFTLTPQESSPKSILELLEKLNTCFNYG